MKNLSNLSGDLTWVFWWSLVKEYSVLGRCSALWSEKQMRPNIIMIESEYQGGCMWL